MVRTLLQIRRRALIPFLGSLVCCLVACGARVEPDLERLNLVSLDVVWQNVYAPAGDGLRFVVNATCAPTDHPNDTAACPNEFTPFAVTSLDASTVYLEPGSHPGGFTVRPNRPGTTTIRVCGVVPGAEGSCIEREVSVNPDLVVALEPSCSS